MCDDLNATDQTHGSDSSNEETYANSLDASITGVGPADFRLHRSAIVAERQELVMMVGVTSRLRSKSLRPGRTDGASYENPGYVS